MGVLIAEDEIVDGAGFVWRGDISRLVYVWRCLDRLSSRSRRGRSAYHCDGWMVGYALLGVQVKPLRTSGVFRREVFWLLPHGRGSEPDGLYAWGATAEAVPG